MQIVPSASGAYEYTLAPLNSALNGTISNEEAARLNRLHGSPESYSESCRTCSKKGFFKTRLHTGEIVTCECNCREQYMLSRVLLSAGIEDAYQRFSWNHVQTVPVDVLMQVADYIRHMDELANIGMGLVLWSERTGTGKSLLSCLVLKEALSRGIKGYFTSFIDMANHYTASWSDAAHKEWFIRRIKNTGMLVVDDVGKENPNRATVIDELFDLVIRARVASNRASILSSNLNPQHVGAADKDFSRYQAGLLDLLSESSTVIEVTGEGYRKKMGERRIADAREGIRYPVVIR